MRRAIALALLAIAAVAGEQDRINRREQARGVFLASPEATFGHYCAHCHGEQGKGDGRMWATELTPRPADLGALDADKAYIVDAIRDGSSVHGKSNLCPPWGRTLTPEGLERLAQFVLEMQGGAQRAAESAGAPEEERFPWLLLVVLATEAVLLWRVRSGQRP